MIDTYSLFTKREIKINDKISVYNPTLKEILEFGSDIYFSLSYSLTSTPFENKVLLDDNGIDYETLSNYMFFLIQVCNTQLKFSDFSLITNIDFKKFAIAESSTTHQIVLYNQEEDIVIDESIYNQFVDAIRAINHYNKNVDRAGNEHAKKYLIDKERRQLKRLKYSNKNKNKSLLDTVSAMVNSNGFKYDYNTVFDLSIYVFYDAVKKISKIKSVENLMNGIYSGNIKSDSISDEKLNWLGDYD